MAISSIKTSVRNAQADAAVDAIDLGTTNSTGRIRLYTAAFATLLVECNFANPAFGNAATGVATANSIATGTCVASGTTTVGRVVDRDLNVIWEFTVGTSGSDLNLSSNVLATSDTVSVTSFTFTQPAS